MPKRRYVVLTDSASDLPPELQRQRGIDIANFEITVDGKLYTERVDFDFDEYYEMLRSCEGIPSTAHVTSMRFFDIFSAYADEGVEEVLYVCINAAGSATCHAAEMARERLAEERPDCPMRIHIVDSHCYSMAYGWYVAEAARKLENGAEMRDVIAWLDEVFARVEIVLAAYSLRFMKKSGRISAAAAFAGELLGLRPIVTLNDGISTVQKKVRGDKEVLPALVAHAAAHIDEDCEYAVGGTDSGRIEELAALCTKQWKKKPTILFKLGAAVATNTGPDAIAITYLGQKRERR